MRCCRDRDKTNFDQLLGASEAQVELLDDLFEFGVGKEHTCGTSFGIYGYRGSISHLVIWRVSCEGEIGRDLVFQRPGDRIHAERHHL